MHEQDSMRISRRRAITSIGSLLLYLQTKPVIAQQISPSQQIFQWHLDAYNLRELATRLPDNSINDDVLLEYIRRDYNLRRNTLLVANEYGYFNNLGSATEYIQNIPPTVYENLPIEREQSTIDSQLTLVSDLQGEYLPIAPNPELVSPEYIPSIPQQDIEFEDSNLIIAGDIFLNTLGIFSGEESLIVTILNETPEVRNEFESLLAAMSTYNWEDVVAIGEALFKFFVGGRTWVNMSKRMKRKVTFSMALKCVPIVGWLYFGVSFAVSLKKNFHRFEF